MSRTLLNCFAISVLKSYSFGQVIYFSFMACFADCLTICMSLSCTNDLTPSMITFYFYFLTENFKTFKLVKVCNETTSISISFIRLFETSSYSTLRNALISMGNYLSLLPYKLSDFRFFNWPSRSMYGSRSLICL